MDITIQLFPNRTLTTTNQLFARRVLEWESKILNTQTKRDSAGYLFDPSDWNENYAIELAKDEGIELTDCYWPILNFMRRYYTEHGIAPDVRHLINFLATSNKLSKKEAKNHIFSLFPYGYVKQACKIAGMKQPRAWSTG